MRSEKCEGSSEKCSCVRPSPGLDRQAQAQGTEEKPPEYYLGKVGAGRSIRLIFQVLRARPRWNLCWDCRDIYDQFSFFVH